MDSEEFQRRIEMLRSTDIDSVENAIRELGNSDDKRAIPILLNMLSTETNINILNALALGLSDLRAQEALPQLIKYIKDPKNKDSNGSFVYALQNLDCRDYFIDIVEMICVGHYEVYDAALRVFESIVDDVGYAEKLKAAELLKRQEQIELELPPSKNPNYDRIHFIQDALKMID